MNVRYKVERKGKPMEDRQHISPYSPRTSSARAQPEAKVRITRDIATTAAIGFFAVHAAQWTVTLLFGLLHGFNFGDVDKSGLDGAKIGCRLIVMSYSNVIPPLFVSGFGVITGIVIDKVRRLSAFPFVLCVFLTEAGILFGFLLLTYLGLYLLAGQ
jgi:hypothetical protein